LLLTKATPWQSREEPRLLLLAILRCEEGERAGPESSKVMTKNCIAGVALTHELRLVECTGLVNLEVMSTASCFDCELLAINIEDRATAMQKSVVVMIDRSIKHGGCRMAIVTAMMLLQMK